MRRLHSSLSSDRKSSKMDEANEKISRSKSNTGKKEKGDDFGIIVHDIDLMNKTELRYYISRLEDELKQTRNDCSLSCDAKNKLASLVTQVQDIYFEKKHCLTAEDFKANDTIHGCEDCLKTFRFKTEYNELRKHEQQALQSFTYFLNDTSDKLIKSKLERNQAAQRFSAVEGLLSEIVTMDMIVCDLFGNYKNLSREISFEHVLRCRDAMQKFNAIKKRILNSIWDYDFCKEEPISIEIEKLQFYFNEVHEDNVKSIQKRREKVAFLQDQCEKVVSDLNKALNLNAELEKQNISLNMEASESKPEILNKRHFIDELTDIDIDNLAVLNLELKNKFKSLEEESLNTKNKFLYNVRKIYRIAEFKSFVIEEIIRLGLVIKEAEISDTKDTCSHLELKTNVKTKQSPEKNYRLLKMSCVGPNTMFVPPVF